ncbi:unnamed protein product [Dovyalis caffra]|uniref:Protein kinase domain-containing protein n=1 Tax=Dovyalis caffra TaxID=77055 RepID=A0AAV1RT19_9ROSI|nr:unnamed protein product [Dovyalis caffra]
MLYIDDEISCSSLANGSIQPSNIMLDANLNAKLMDFDPKWFTSDDDPFMMLKSLSVRDEWGSVDGGAAGARAAADGVGAVSDCAVDMVK